MKQKLKLSPNEITFGISRDNYNENPEVQEYLVQEYHQKLKHTREAIKTNIEQNKEKYINKINETREDAPKLPEEVYIRKPSSDKKDVKYQKGKQSNGKFETLKGKRKKLHPSQIKRPKKKKNNSEKTPTRHGTEQNECLADNAYPQKLNEEIEKRIQQLRVNPDNLPVADFEDEGLFQVSSDPPSSGTDPPDRNVENPDAVEWPWSFDHSDEFVVSDDGMVHFPTL